MSAVTLRSRRGLRAAAAMVTACALLAGPLLMPAAAPAQNQFGVPAQSKEEARAAREGGGGVDTGGGISTQTAMILGALVVLGAAGAYIVIDSSGAVRGERDRPGGAAPLRGSETGRGVPKTMFSGEAAPGGRTGKAKKREKTRRQKQARRKNR